MVAFMSPKRSKVDIVQATGRAMRKDPHNPDKVLGYILVPLYLEITTGERIEDAVENADFGEVWNVLQALQEQDEMLTDIIRQIQENKGKGGEEKGDGFGDIIDILGVDISLKTLQESITAVCIDKLGFTWDFRYGELIKYKELFGHCNVPHICAENKKLGIWVNVQRNKYKDKKISHDRIKRLEDIGFAWNQRDSQWEEAFNALQEYKGNHGHCNVPFRYAVNNIKLGIWVNVQRNFYRDKRISHDRTKRLEGIGFVWNANESAWEESFNALKEYEKLHGHCNVPSEYLVNNIKLGIWVVAQRQYYRKGKLSHDRIKCLEEIGFIWSKLESQWEEMFGALEEYKKKHGDCNVPQHWAENKQLARWVLTQRNCYRDEKISHDRIKRLEDIGFIWNPFESQWEEMFNALKEYKGNHGHCNIPQQWAENKRLAGWVGKQRQDYRKEKLNKDQINLLKEIGFVWEPRDINWEEMFDALREFKKNHGHCNVPSGWSGNQRLANWVAVQRQFYRKEKLSKDQIKRLEDIGFVWNIHKR
jgi:hypothetical protein